MFYYQYLYFFIFYCFVFFFSSRRRHTRLVSDWSSDVCSSDLIKLADRLHNLRTIEYLGKQKQVQKAREALEVYAPLRSEERRVGKECRSRWSTYECKKKKEI